MQADRPYILGLTGGSASGKTLFLKQLISDIGEENVCLLPQDNYYFARNQQPVDDKGVKNFDLPDSINFQDFVNDIKALKKGKTITRKEYTFNNPDAPERILTFTPAPILIIEGIFVFYIQEVYELLDLKLFIDAKEHIKLKRRVIRDKEERGYDLDDVLYRYEHHVSPTYEKYIEPYKEMADLIIPNNQGFDKALEVIINFLKNKL
jgi:uridine kinase